jgi:Leucine-rich repeat (LRR) protein
LFCEKVTQPCICRIERVLEKINSNTIETINLSNNNLESLPPSLAKMINLKVLNLNDNNLRTIPDEIISKLINLEELHVKSNPLIQIPDIKLMTTRIFK